MNRTVILLLVSAVLVGAAAAAQLYRWVDEKGNVEYRDTPPPASAKKVEQRVIGGSGAVESSSLPFSVQQAMKNFPVTLWNSACGAACDQARAHLVRRGVPHTEKHPQADFETFQKLTGSLEVPVLFVGSTQLKGYLESDWDAALDAAGYPRTPPLGYKPAAKPSQATRPPVKLYTHPTCGAPCEEAKTLLASRKVGFEEIVAERQEIIDELQKVSGATHVPVLLVGTVVTRGFSSPDFHMVLDAAGFPRAQ